MEYDHEKVDEMTVALMYLVLHGARSEASTGRVTFPSSPRRSRTIVRRATLFFR